MLNIAALSLPADLHYASVLTLCQMKPEPNRDSSFCSITTLIYERIYETTSSGHVTYCILRSTAILQSTSTVLRAGGLPGVQGKRCRGVAMEPAQLVSSSLNLLLVWKDLIVDFLMFIVVCYFLLTLIFCFLVLLLCFLVVWCCIALVVLLLSLDLIYF